MYQDLGFWFFDNHGYISELEIWHYFRRVGYEFYEPPWFLEGDLVQFLITAQHWDYSSVGWVFDFVNSYQFWFFKLFQH